MKTYIGVMLRRGLRAVRSWPRAQEQAVRRGAGQRQAGAAAAGRPAAAHGRRPVDLSGVWFPGPTGKANAWSVVPDERAQRRIRSRSSRGRGEAQGDERVELELQQRQRQLHAARHAGHVHRQRRTRTRSCMKPGLFVHLIENNNRWRVVHTDGRPHKPKEEQEPLFYGDTDGALGGRHAGHRHHLDRRAHLDSRRLVPQRRAARDRAPPAAVDELSRVPVHDRGSEGADQAVDVGLATRYSLSANNEDLTENFCTNNENVEQLRKLYEAQKPK